MVAFLTLGDVSFENTEIPEGMPWGSSQNTYLHEFLGGKRQVNPMGVRYKDITWSGLFFGSTAVFRARYLDGMCVDGKQLNLIWDEFNYSVVIKDFSPIFVRDNNIPYSITVEIVQDLNKPFPVLLPDAYDDAVAEAIQEAKDLAAVIQEGGIEGKLAELAAAIDGVADIGNATSSEIAAITGPLNSLSSAVSDSIGSTSSGLFG